MATDPQEEGTAPWSQALSQALFVLSDITTQIADAVDGYRAQCVERGYSMGVAEQMALQAHGAIIASVFGKIETK
jgi:hypothetical protein